MQILDSQAESAKKISDQLYDYDKFVKQELNATKVQIKEFFSTISTSDSKVSSDYTCTICKNLLFEPRICQKCTNAKYCKICVDKHVDKNDDWKNPPKCLKCNKNIEVGNLKPTDLGKLNSYVFNISVGGQVIKLPYIDIQTYFQDNIFKKVTKCPLDCHQSFDSMLASQEHLAYL